MSDKELISGMLREEGGFQKALRNMLDNELDMTVNEFCLATGISQSTMYKILEEKREPNLRTIRAIIKAVRYLSAKPDERFIAIIASHQVLQTVSDSVKVGNRTIRLREYPVATMEDAIISAVKAERDGALAVVCAPIIEPTIEKILTIPVAPVIPTTSIYEAIERIRNDI
ncbi:MAG: helix-turn-helix domain-containing protein [Methanomassiliicoccaceae archaeon]|jgi:predicted transcriptional regulator|nr:helix-turn-helix domain-containing protein [Methanomassiliicoccaceae archaeon]